MLCAFLFRLVFSQNSVLVPDSSNISTIYRVKSSGLSVGYNNINLKFIAPSAGYIICFNCAITVDYWVSVNGHVLSHKCHYSQSGNFLIPVAKGDIYAIDRFWLRTSMTDESKITMYFFPAKVVKVSDI